MADFRESLQSHLEKSRAAPFLFVGAGVSLRYLKLDDWKTLLRRLADLTGKDYEYYAASAEEELPAIATLIAEDLHEAWWNDERFEPSRKRFVGKVHRRDSGLKAEASNYFASSLRRLPKRGPLADELALLRKVVVDGIITTNFDPLLEAVFPDFRVYVGQEELLFEDPRGVGEIYKIHGSHEEPDSLVLTRADYDRFNERNPYLAAKLMTIFVEHPIVFLGYSLTDPNIGSILHSIVSCMSTKERVGQLADRLIFVQWNPEADEAAMAHAVIPVDGNPIPVMTLTVPDFVELFEVLGNLRRRFSAKLLRQLKEQVHELVLENDPNGRLHVLPLDPEADPRDVDLVFGVGAIAHLRSYVGLTRENLLDDIIREEAELNPIRVAQEALPNMLTHAGNVPVYKYLRRAGLLDDGGELLNPQTVDWKLVNHIARRSERLGLLDSDEKRAKAAAGRHSTLPELVLAEEPKDVLRFIPALDEDHLDPEALRRFLIDNEDLLDHDFHRSQWIKMACVYDWLVNGRQLESPTRVRGARRAPRRTRAAQRKGRQSRPA